MFGIDVKVIYCRSPRLRSHKFHDWQTSASSMLDYKTGERLSDRNRIRSDVHDFPHIVAAATMG